MAEALTVLAIVILLSCAAGLWRVLRGASPANRLMATQLLATGAAATLLVLGVATGQAALLDVAHRIEDALWKALWPVAGLSLLGLVLALIALLTLR